MKMFRFVDIYRFVSVADATEDANGCRHSERTGQFVSGSGKRDSPITRPKVETNSESVEEDKNLKIEKASIPAEPITNEQIKNSARIANQDLGLGKDPGKVLQKYCQSMRGILPAKLPEVGEQNVKLGVSLYNELRGVIRLASRRGKEAAVSECRDYILVIGLLPKIFKKGDFSGWQKNFHKEKGKDVLEKTAFCYANYELTIRGEKPLHIMVDIKATHNGGLSVYSLITSKQKNWETKKEMIKSKGESFENIRKLIPTKDESNLKWTYEIVGIRIV